MILNVFLKDWTKICGGLLFLVLLILLTSCNREPGEKLVYPEPDSTQAQLYLLKCGECHAAPLPTAHIAITWVRVIERMQYRMISKKIAPLNDDEKASILEYLQKYAKNNKT